MGTSLLAIDIGNSNVACAVYQDNVWSSIFRIETHQAHDNRLCRDFFSNILESEKIDRIIISSVVPQLTEHICACLRSLKNNIETLKLHNNFQSPLSQRPPSEMGQDLFANAVASFSKSNIVLKKSIIGNNKSFSYASLTIDMGTALSFTAVRRDGSIAGVAISPGIDTSYRALIGKTAQIQELTLNMPQKALGLDTQSALNAGVMLGFRYLIIGMIERIKSELHEPCKIYGTGGLSPLMSSLSSPHSTTFTEIDPYHTLEGLRILADYN